MPVLLMAQESSGENDTEEVFELDQLIVEGMSASMRKAREIKQNSGQIVDAIVADDINKLPDLSVTEALQRISGIQVTRDLGEGATVSLRGLNEVTSTINGQEVFSPQIVTGESRVMNLQTIPSDMIAAINVVKSPTADMIEGGIAGTIDIVLRKPFDFDGETHANVNIRGSQGEIAEKARLQYSVMLTDTWDTSIGEVGALVSHTRQARVGRQDMNQTGAPQSYNVGMADEVIGHGNSYELRFLIDRERHGNLVTLQWAPTDNLMFFLEYNNSKQESAQKTVGPQFDPNPSNRTATDLVLADQMITYTRDNPVTGAKNETVTVPWADAMTVTGGAGIGFSSYRWWLEDTDQYSFGAFYAGEDFTVEAELSYTDVFTDFFYNGPWIQTDYVLDYRHDSRGSLPKTYPLNPEVMLDPNNFVRYWGTWTAWRQNHADAFTGTVDVTQSFGSGFFTSAKYGARYSSRASGQDEYGGEWLNGFSGLATPPMPSESNGLLVRNTLSDFFDGASGKTNDFIYPSAEIYEASDVRTSWERLATAIGGGVSTVLPATPQDRIWEVEEDTYAGYAMVNFDRAGTLPFDGNIGVRVIQTEITSSGYKREASGTWEPFTEKGDYVDVLPSLNTRFHLPTKDLFLRVSLSQQLSRQSLSSLNSRVTLSPAAPGLDYDWTGSAGNPSLEPLRTDAIDLALEKYFNPSTYVYASVYKKKIDGYVERREEVEDIEGERVLVSRPYNVNNAEVKGFEFGYQQIFDFLPTPFSGLGINANYTYVDATDPSGNPLQNLSKNSYNLILFYEYQRFAARVAYNWRDSFVRSTTSGGILGTVPLVDEAFGWMDATVSYNVTDNIRVQLDVTNVLKVHREDHYDGNELYDHEDILEDRMWYLSVNWKL